MKTRVAVAVTLIFLLASAGGAQAQSETPRFQSGIQFTDLRTAGPGRSLFGGPGGHQFGIGGTFVFNLNRRFSLDSSVNFFPENIAIGTSAFRYGRGTQALFGAKVGLIRTPRFAVFAKARPGFVSFGDVRATLLFGSIGGIGGAFIAPANQLSSTGDFGRQTQFAFDVGVAAEFYPSRHLYLRLDAGDTIVHYDALSVVLAAAPLAPVITMPERTLNHLQLSTGVGYRFGGSVGEAETARPPERGIPRYQVAAQFTDMRTFQNEFGVGGTFTYNLGPRFSLDGTVNFFPTATAVQAIFPGRGLALEGLFGAKLALLRTDRLALFAKARPGFLSFAGRSSEFPGIGSLGTATVLPEEDVRRRTHFTTDIGGVLEIYPSKATYVRFDAGDTIVRYGAADFLVPQVVLNQATISTILVPYHLPGYISHQYQFSTGFGYRFGGSAGEAKPMPAPPSMPRFELGVHAAGFDIVDTEFGAGGLLSFNVHPRVALETVLNDFPGNVTYQRPGIQGGHLLQGQFGPKFLLLGNEKVALSAKVRPGFVSFSEVKSMISFPTIVANQIVVENIPVILGRETHFSFDYGGVVQYFPSRHTALRVEFGDTLISYPGLSAPLPPINNPALGTLFANPRIGLTSGVTEHNFQFSTGVSWRF